MTCQTYLEKVERRHRLQDEREAANEKILKERQQTREEREREYKEKDRIHEERIKEKLKFYKEQQQRKYDSIKEVTQDIEAQFDDLSTYLEKVERRHRLQDEREAAEEKLLKERQQTREEREREYKEKDRFHEERIKALEADRKEMERANDLLEERRTQRWRDLIVANRSDDHELDPEVLSIVSSLDIKRKVKAQMEMWFTMDK